MDGQLDGQKRERENEKQKQFSASDSLDISPGEKKTFSKGLAFSWRNRKTESQREKIPSRLKQWIRKWREKEEEKKDDDTRH